jgi:hypothetical protein
MKKWKRAVLLLLVIVAVLFSATASGALSFLNMDRITEAASAKSDISGIVGLDGFSGSSYLIGSGYTRTGTITNNGTRDLQLRVFIDPDVTALNKNAAWSLSFRIVDPDGRAYDAAAFSGAGSFDPTGSWTAYIRLPPGKTALLQASLQTTLAKRFQATAFFGFEAGDNSGFSVLIYKPGDPDRMQRYTAE